MEFRALLINLFNQLSDNDRQALHFLVGNRVPRQNRDDCTPSGSLRLLDFLFDRNIITEQNFDYLIHVFEDIKCHDASKQLKKYKLLNICTISSESMLTESSSFSESFSNIQDDKMQSCTNDLSIRLPSITEEQSSTAVEIPLLRPHSKTFSEQKYNFNEQERCQSSSTISKALNSKYYLLSTSLILITILCVLLCLQLYWFFFLQSPKSEKSSSVLSHNQKTFYIIQEGLQYGANSLIQKETFNDAKDFQLSFNDKCIGVEVIWSNDTLISVHFLYSNNKMPIVRNNQSKEFSTIPSRFSTIIKLNMNEEINKINLYQCLHKTNACLVGIQFRTTLGRKTPVFGSNIGHFLTESFEHYTFAYSKGRQDIENGIEMLQFIWFKETSINEQIFTVPRKMLESCEFFFISSKDYKLVHSRGIESSWYDLSFQFNLQSDQCDLNASYYRRISERGPKIFAIVDGTSVFYYDNDKWYKYRSTLNITCTMIPWLDTNLLKE